MTTDRRERMVATLGRHVIAELYGADPKRLDDLFVVRRCLREAAEVVGATIVGEAFHRFSPQGVSGAVVIAESHLSVHTWPEAGYVAVDIFTCGGLDPRPGIEHIGRGLGATSYRVQEIARGLPAEIAQAGKVLAPGDVAITRDDVQVYPLI